MSAIFMKAEWRRLIMANYPIDPAALRPFLPARTELDFWEGETYVSLVGFQFRKVRVRGLLIPFHTNFPEVNLRFYVRYKDGQQWKRGVVFVREIVPLPAVTFFANTLFYERYITLPIRLADSSDGISLKLGYHWKYKGWWNHLVADAAPVPQPLRTGSQEEFITEHFWGYRSADTDRTGEYQVAHPRWDIYKLNWYKIDCYFGELYGAPFAVLNKQDPQSVFLAEGSPVEIYTKRYIS
jgi:uncharacterized protein YqjF (DUF2071 family)